MRSLQLPPNLVPSQKIRVIAPSGAIREWERFNKGVQIWRDRGYEVFIPEGLDQTWGYLAGTDIHRSQQFIEAWQDPDCAAIICARGGYGAARMLEILDWQELNDSKWLIGFSDVTALLWGLAAKRGIASLHGPVLTTLANESESSIQQLFDWLEGRIDKVTLKGDGWGGGQAKGVLLAANLNLSTHLLGTELCPNLENVILAFEDVFEPPYKVDRMLTHWRLSEALHKVKGVALGRFSGGEVSGDRPSLSMEEVWRDRLMDLDIPIVVNLPFGHDGSNTILALGCNAELDGEIGTLIYQR